ncbi:protein GVQW3-like [Aphis craccivora]|uniref:Protein GVQW3-like n=1 Tax=Aphis craccivora TaxID=307492 RepID=A0A6G0VTV3_APHCR|nr:protein GVQW3-like [Aphis craccivora]
MANVLGIWYGSVQNILKDDLGMRRVCAKFVPRILTEDQMENRKLIAAELFERSVNEKDFLSKIITRDETWVFAYDPETKLHSSEWHTTTSPRPKKSRVVKSQLKVMFIVFFDSEGLVHLEFVSNGQMVNSSFYIEVLKCLRDPIWRKRQ